MIDIALLGPEVSIKMAAIANLVTLETLILGAFGLVLVSLFIMYWNASARQRRVSEQVNTFLKQQEVANQQLKQMVMELRRHTRLLNELLDEAANSPDYDMEDADLDEMTDAFLDEAMSEIQSGIHRSENDSAAPVSLEGPVSRKIYVGNLHYDATEEELFDLFQYYGDIESVNIPLNRYNGKARGFGFVTFISENDAEQAAKGMQGASFKNRILQVNYAKERDTA